MVPINPACTGASGGGSYMCFSKCAEEQALIAFMMGKHLKDHSILQLWRKTFEAWPNDATHKSCWGDCELLCLYFSHWWNQNTDVSHHGNLSSCLEHPWQLRKKWLGKPKNRIYPQFCRKWVLYNHRKSRVYSWVYHIEGIYILYIYNVVGLVHCLKKNCCLCGQGPR